VRTAESFAQAYLEIAGGVTQEAEKLVLGNVELKGTGLQSVMHTHWITHIQRICQKIPCASQKFIPLLVRGGVKQNVNPRIDPRASHHHGSRTATRGSY
jgi:hypothetical protein